MEIIISQNIKVKDIEVNKGQIPGVKKNPRFIKDDTFKKLLKSIQDNPEMLSLREILVYPIPGKKNKYVVIGGNMRYRACKELLFTELPCKVIPENTPAETLNAYIIKDNGSFGDWDMDALANEWSDMPLSDWGVPICDDWQEEDESGSDDAPLIDETDGDKFIVEIICASQTEQNDLYKRLSSEKYQVRKKF